MKNRYVLITFLILSIPISFISSCGKEEIILGEDLIGDWKVVSFEDNETNARITKTDENTYIDINNGDITVNFTNSDLTSGVMSGRKVTNVFSADYIVNAENGISICCLNSTKIGEPEWARLFDSIRNVEAYEIKDELLIFFYNQKKNSIILEKVTN